MNKIAIVTDSTSDLPKDLVEKYKIKFTSHQELKEHFSSQH